MNYRTIDQTRHLATILPAETLSPPSFSMRLERWADRLDQHTAGNLKLLQRIEFASSAQRDTLREEQSPLSVAFADPVLRAQGLSNDTYGEARRFFGIRHQALHEIVCYCHYSSADVPGAFVAARVRRAARRARRIERVTAAGSLCGGAIARSLAQLFL